MSRSSTRRRAEALAAPQRSSREVRTLRTGLGLSVRSVSLLVVALALAAGTWFVAVRPVGEDIAAVDARVEDVERQNATLAQRITAAQAGEPDVLAGLEARARRADEVLPAPVSNIAALELLLPHATGFGLDVTINPGTGKAPAVNGGVDRTMTLQVSGSPGAVQSWLAGLDRLRPMVTVNTVSLRSGEAGTMTGTVDVAVWGTSTPPLATGPSSPAPVAEPPAG